MKRPLIFLFTLLMAFTLQEAGAQSLRTMVRNKIIEDNLEAKAKRDSVKAVEEGREPDQSPNTTMNHVYVDALGLNKVPYESTYNFDSYVKMEVRDFDKNDKETDFIQYDSYVSNDAVDYAIVYREKKDKTTIIFDSKNSTVLFLTDSDGEKMGMATEVDPETMAQNMEEAEAEEGYPLVNPQKTGKTKDILGYKCEEYLIDDEETEIHMWTCEELSKQIRKEMIDPQHTYGAVFLYAAYAKGMVMEYEEKDKESGDRTIMQVTDINLNQSHTISTRAYPVVGVQKDKEEPGDEGTTEDKEE